MAISLNPDTLELIEERMKGAGFSSADEFVRIAVAAFNEQIPLRNMKDAGLEHYYPGFHEKIAQGLAEANAGNLTDGDAFFAELENEEAELEKSDRRTA